jgi:hypothetical protein
MWNNLTIRTRIIGVIVFLLLLVGVAALFISSQVIGISLLMAVGMAVAVFLARIIVKPVRGAHIEWIQSNCNGP